MTTAAKMNKKNEALLSRIYYDPSHSASFSTEKKLYEAARREDESITRQAVKEFLLNQYTYTLHKPARKRFKRNHIVVSGPGVQLQADLVDMQHFAEVNDGFKYILTVIDVFSKVAHAVPLKDKSADSILNALTLIFKKTRPTRLQTDRGKEFKNEKIEAFCRQQV